MADYLACTSSGGGFKCFGCNSVQGGPFYSDSNLSGSVVTNYMCDQWHGASVGQPGPSGTIPIVDKVPYSQNDVKPPIGVKPLRKEKRLKRRRGRFSGYSNMNHGHSNMNHSNFAHSNFVSRGNDNAIWSGSQSNAGPRDRVFAGNYASGRRGCDCDCR